jgi:hypothetical protein
VFLLSVDHEDDVDKHVEVGGASQHLVEDLAPLVRETEESPDEREPVR